MSQFAKQLLAILVLITLALFGFFFFQSKDMANKGDTTATSTPQILSEEEAKELGISFDLEPETPAPVLGRPIVQLVGVDDNVFEIGKKAIDNLSKMIQESPFEYDLWIEWGNYHNILKDYSRAEEAWQYAALIRPFQITAFINLGTLYEREYKQYVEAEKYYLEALDISPDQSTLHLRLFDLYALNLKEKRSEAATVLITALEQFPDNTEILVKLARFLVEEGNFTGARQYYTQAIDVANKQGRADFATDLTDERNRVPRS